MLILGKQFLRRHQMSHRVGCRPGATLSLRRIGLAPQPRDLEIPQLCMTLGLRRIGLAPQLQKLVRFFLLSHLQPAQLHLRKLDALLHALLLHPQLRQMLQLRQNLQLKQLIHVQPQLRQLLQPQLRHLLYLQPQLRQMLQLQPQLRQLHRGLPAHSKRLAFHAHHLLQFVQSQHLLHMWFQCQSQS